VTKISNFWQLSSVRLGVWWSVPSGGCRG